MSVDVVMPQMGESITEGTITKWMKQVGDAVERDEPLFEISTDKVDAEIPAPQAGVLLEIRHQEGETVEVNSVVAVLGAEGESAASASSATSSPAETSKAEEPSAAVAEMAAAPVVEESKPVAVETAPPAASTNSEASTEGATEVVMPQMGESITEGTITKWMKQVGDAVERDEPLFEISTDKVDAEIPAPVAGTLLAINNQEGETVEVGKIVALIGAAGASVSAAPQSQTSVQGQKQAVEATAEATSADVPSVETAKAEIQAQPATAQESVQETEGRSYDYGRPGAIQDAQSTGQNGSASVEDLRKTKSSPLVRNIAKEHGVDIARVEGSGMSGRVTKKDILEYIDSGASVRPEDLLVKLPGNVPSATPRVQAPPTAFASQVQTPGVPAQTIQPAAGDRVEPMSVMRKKIAEKMVTSKQTAPHVTSVYEIDMTNIVKFRNQNKDTFQQRYGTKLTFMPFIFQAVTDALRAYPIVNSQISGDQIVYKGDINLGMAVALDWGLIVPVIKNADQLSMAGLAMTANDLAERARAKKLNPDEVQNGTFTITNTGTFGGLFGVPIINQPQSAIMCFGTIEKRPKVITTPDGDDVIAVRSMAYFALTYDHRIIDGADAEKFLAHVKRHLETGQFNV